MNSAYHSPCVCSSPAERSSRASLDSLQTLRGWCSAGVSGCGTISGKSRLVIAPVGFGGFVLRGRACTHLENLPRTIETKKDGTSMHWIDRSHPDPRNTGIGMRPVDSLDDRWLLRESFLVSPPSGFVADPDFSLLISHSPSAAPCNAGGLVYSDEKERGTNGIRPGTQHGRCCGRSFRPSAICQRGNARGPTTRSE